MKMSFLSELLFYYYYMVYIPYLQVKSLME